MSNQRNIFFVYNAKGGRWNYLIDTIHKYASPSTYDCNLCQITHDLSMRKAWKDFIEKTPHIFHFLHSEELEDLGLNEYLGQLPICLEKIGQKYSVIIDQKTINSFQNEFELIDKLNQIL